MGDKENILAKIEAEGFEYWLAEYAQPDDMPDPKYGALIVQAREAIQELKDYLGLVE